MMKPQISLFAEHEREDRGTTIVDPLIGLTKDVDFEALAAGIDAAVPRTSRAKGYKARCGQIVNVSPLQAPFQRSKREEADIIEDGTMPLGWKPHKRARKDVGARGTKKHGKSYFGYKSHASVDKRYKLMSKMVVTHAAVADATVFEPLLDRANTSRDGYAVRGYPTAERAATLKHAGWHIQIPRKGSATKGISDTQKKRKRRITTPRATLDHAFGALAQLGGKVARCMAIFRVTISLHLKAARYNLKRLAFLKKGGLAPF